MPTDNRLGLDDNDHLECGVPEPRDAGPEQSVGSFQEGPWPLLLEHTELLTKRDVVECDAESGGGESEQEVEHQERPAEDRDQCSSPVAAVEQGEKEGGCGRDDESHRGRVALRIRSARWSGQISGPIP